MIQYSAATLPCRPPTSDLRVTVPGTQVLEAILKFYNRFPGTVTKGMLNHK